MNLRIRDFIETERNLIFAVVSYYSPEDRHIAFLRYYPSSTGERERSSQRFHKVASTQESFEFLEKNFPEHVFYSEAAGSKLQCVPKEKVSKIYHPNERLKEIAANPKNYLEQRASQLSEVLGTISASKKGVTGSLLVELHEPTSDIDFVVYGVKNHNRAREMLKQEFEEKSKVRELTKGEWYKVYTKRFQHHETLTFEEFLWHERRKFHKGAIGNTIFDVLLVRDFGEIKEKYSDKKFRRLGKITQKCVVTDSLLAFDSPAIYRVECEDERIKEVVSFTHTYAGQAFEGEEIEVSGFLEEVAGKENYCRIVVGTTREAEEEYIKVKAP